MSLEVNFHSKYKYLSYRSRSVLFQETKHSPFQRQRNILYLISQYLSDFGLKQTKTALWNEANLSVDFKICDNIDLDTIYLDFCSYYHLKFGKLPKIVKRIETEANDCNFNKGKLNKGKSSESTQKSTEDCQKKLKKDTNGTAIDEFVVTSSFSGEVVNGEKKEESTEVLEKYRRSTVLFEHFSGELRDLAHVIERQIVKRSYNIKWNDVLGNEHAKQILNEVCVV